MLLPQPTCFHRDLETKTRRAIQKAGEKSPSATRTIKCLEQENDLIDKKCSGLPTSSLPPWLLGGHVVPQVRKQTHTRHGVHPHLFPAISRLHQQKNKLFFGSGMLCLSISPHVLKDKHLSCQAVESESRVTLIFRPPDADAVGSQGSMVGRG